MQWAVGIIPNRQMANVCICHCEARSAEAISTAQRRSSEYCSAVEIASSLRSSQ
jgi:hypothetical protein